MTRQIFEMTRDDLKELLDAMKPVPMIMLQCGKPVSLQVKANAAWATLGKKMGFCGMSVQPVVGRGNMVFSAETVDSDAKS